MSSFIIRRIDELGRIVLPKEWRVLNKINEKDPLEIHIDGRTITIKKHEISCIFCGNKKNLSVYNEFQVCNKCIDSLILSRKVD